MSIRTGGTDNTAYHDGWIQIGMSQHRGHHRSSRSLSVRTSHSQSVWFKTHQLSQHLRARNDRDRSSLGFNNFRIVIAHGRGTNYHMRITDIARWMSFVEFNNHFPQTIAQRRMLQKRTGYAV